MKNRPLSFQIWTVVVCTTAGVCLLVAALLPVVVGRFFTKEIFETIENAQAMRFPQKIADFEELRRRGTPDPSEAQTMRTVSHALVRDDGAVVAGARLPPQIIEVIAHTASAQSAATGRYTADVDGRTLYYVVRRLPAPFRDVSVVSFMWDAYRDRLVRTLSLQIGCVLVAVLLLSWLPAVWLARRLTRPLVRLEEHVQAIADRRWDRPIPVDRRDEIGRLAASIERMRDRLKRQDEAERSFLQRVSHGLKTPVMVVRSYAQAIRDGIFPQGDLMQSVDIIEREAERLEKGIRDLLYLAKLDYYLSSAPASAGAVLREPFAFDRLVASAVERMRWRRPDLAWELELSPLTLAGDTEQWTAAVENLVDNAIRHAASRIAVRLTVREKRAELSIENDGPPIDENTRERLFQPFGAGPGGEFGLGLAIVRRIADLHGAVIFAENTDGGVAFKVEFGEEPGETRCREEGGTST